MWTKCRNDVDSISENHATPQYKESLEQANLIEGICEKSDSKLIQLRDCAESSIRPRAAQYTIPTHG